MAFLYEIKNPYISVWVRIWCWLKGIEPTSPCVRCRGFTNKLNQQFGNYISIFGLCQAKFQR